MMKEDSHSDLVLFDERGKENTSKCLRLVADRMEEKEIDKAVVASTSGETGVRALKSFSDMDVKLVVVSHQFGFKEDGEIELKERNKEKIESSETASLVVTPDILTRVPKMSRGKYGGSTYLDLIADTLRLFSEGMKVCVECSVQATDSGEIPSGEEIAAIAGTGSGADTGIILESKHSHKLFDIDIKEIVCMPRQR